ncbi:MAG: HAMP domain-containing sensor histidine kinase, partial [Tissierellia bacterium]|nr:HAMP domain-containing sensor histidine kinase [Tissierellia bacterium]
ENEIYQNISIENQGYMIPREKQNKIFERFYKLDPKSKGFGIGLPMAKVIMEEHGGKIFVESDEDKTTFHLRFYK